jgi:hypothetical protein
MSIYTAVAGQTLYDVCILTYGSIDYIVKLARDNNIIDLSNDNLSGVEFTYDNSLVVSQALQQALNQQYGTGNGVPKDITDAYISENRTYYYISEDRTKYLKNE